MAAITEKENGTYLVRVYCGRDNCGKQVFKSKTFRPSKRNLPYQKLTAELNSFVTSFENELKENALSAEFKRNDDPSKMPFAAFCKEFINIKKDTLSPNTLLFYCRVIDKHLIPMFGKMRLEECSNVR